MKQALKKKTFSGGSSSGLQSWKQKKGFVVDPESEEDTISSQNANKPQDWILMPKAFQDVTKLPGVPLNTVVSVIGHSNVGKTTLVNHAISSAQGRGLIPVIIDTENAFSFEYAKSMGFKCEPVYADVEVIDEVDLETGEIVSSHTEKQVKRWDGDFIYFDTNMLAEQYGDIDYSSGKRQKTKRSIAVIEDVASAINELLDAQENGEIQQGFLFVWDSVGSIGCFKEVSAGKIGNNMWAAGALSQAFSLIVNNRIPSSKKVSSQFDNTFLYINKVWLDSMTNPVGPPSIKTKGGNSMKYATRLEILMGGQLTSGIKRLTATSKGVDYSYGIETKIKILKNHLDAPHNVCYEGKMVATDVGFIGCEELEDFKKTHVAKILKELNKKAEGKEDIKESDIQFSESEELNE